ncbi:carboxyl-terminal processing protease CtpC [Lyngbya confervoides]|uniref:Carboxyl-terminal-processing protease n=1 Tax=Lyngbya confervoides BDU141951 TaxID=1574623 RepID=A0ABD4T433_9CYAN|nr:carboxyl-terminal processing protease CtpC [Lyngbya confervoides]MCM1983448.1 S41 family peptidase [Lyngbya confervoides BDU141951]
MVISTRGLVLGTTALLGTGVVVTGAGLSQLPSSWALFKESPKETIDEVWQVIEHDFVDASFNGVDWHAVRSDYLNRKYQSKEEAYDAIREMVDQLGDPYTRFMDPEQFKSMQIDTSGELTGVGIQISQEEDTKNIVVISPIEDSPAAAAGILAQDVILQVDGQSTEGMDINEVVSLIRGPVNSEVTLSIARGDERLNFTIKRARIEIHPVRFSFRQNGASGGIGYIRLNQFSGNAASEMKDAIQKLNNQNVSGFILDLRLNPGGLLYSSAEIARMWMDKGTIVTTINRQGEVDRLTAGRGQLTNKPLVVLVDQGSASASEILAGALQDNHRATIVGATTFGKGLVQSVHPLQDGSGLAVTVAKYHTPSGRDIHKSGIVPDIQIELTEEQLETLRRDQIGTPADPQYAKALQVLTEQISKGKAGETLGASNRSKSGV